MYPIDYFDVAAFGHLKIFEGVHAVWEVLARIGPYILKHGDAQVLPTTAEGIHLAETTVIHEGKLITKNITIENEGATKGKLWIFRKGRKLEGASVFCAGAILVGGPIAIGRGTIVESGAYIRGPALIGDQCEVRQGAYIRGDVLTGTGCVIGHATEVKNSIFMDHAKAGHFAYVGDSVLGRNVNLGAGTKLANLKIVPGNVTVPSGNEIVDTGRRKLGAILGDGCETGCNSVTSPGTLLGPGSILYPNITARAGIYPPGTLIAPSKGSQVTKKLRKR